MEATRRIWLVYNEASGNNDRTSVEAVQDALRAAGFDPIEKCCFPNDPIPRPTDLRSSGADLLAVFAGDGTVSATVMALYGWEGAILVLPGGTMNFLARRLHGDASAVEIVCRLADGMMKKARSEVIRCRYGDALTDVVAGPGTAWNDVREALRNTDILETVSNASQAIAESTQGAFVRCVDPVCGRDEGYSAITLTPKATGLEAKGYFADTLADFARQGVALLQRNFRTGPHERLGLHASWRLACNEGQPMGLLIDGEPCEAGVEEEFTLARCEVDLLRSANAA